MSYSVHKLGLDHFLKGLLELVLPGEEGKKYTHNYVMHKDVLVQEVHKQCLFILFG